MATVKTRKTLSAEQQAATDARKSRFQSFAKTVGDMSEDERMALVERHGAILNVEGRALSTVNSVLIIMQNPAATVVGGFAQWNKVGRKIRKGESGLQIWVPINRTERGEQPATPAPGDKPKGKPGFLCGYVWSFEQTEVAEVK